MSITTQVLLSAFVITFVMGAVAVKTNFCTMGAVSDVVNMGDTGRLRAWFFAIAVAIAGVLGLQWAGVIDMSLTASNETAIPPYRTAMFAWPRYVLGGLLFGIGMTIGSGCGNKNLLRVGGGNVKSLFTLLAMGVGAYLMLFTNFGYNVFLRWMQPLFVDFSALEVSHQGLPALAARLTGLDEGVLEYGLGGALALGLAAWAFRSTDFRGRLDNILGGFTVGAAVVAAWFVTAGPWGQQWMEEVEFLDERPIAVGAQALTFVQPSGQFLHWAESGFAATLVSFAMLAALGAVTGAFVYSLLTRAFRLEWFASARDFVNHVAGGFLMGIGGVLGMGCTIGQGVSGASTLALGSFLTLGAIVLGSALTMKFQYYRLVYEAEASVPKALAASLADLRLWPQGLRQLERV